MTGFASGLRQGIDVACHSRPCNQSRLGEPSHIDGKVVDCLGRVGRDDFQILPAAQRNEGVLRADAGVASAADGSHPGPLLNPGNSRIEIGAAQQ